MMKNFVLVFLVYLSVASCNESLNDIDKNVVSATFLEQSESNLILKQKFSSALVKVLGQNEEVRSLSFNKLDKALLCLFIIICNFIEHSI